MLQADRRTNPYPYTWEIPVGVATVLLLLAVVGVHIGRGVASWFAGSGWVWPTSRRLFASLPAVLTGDATAGLASGTDVTATPAAVIGWIVTVEVLLLAAAVAALIFGLRRWGPGRMKGMASAAEAETILGVTRLRNNAAIIRPDLYGPRTSRSTSTTGGHNGYHVA